MAVRNGRPDTNTSLSRLGTGQPNDPEFGIGILIHGLCQSGGSFEICRVAWLAAFFYETVPAVFVMHNGGLQLVQQLILPPRSSVPPPSLLPSSLPPSSLTPSLLPPFLCG